MKVDISVVKDMNKLIRKQMKAIDAVFELHKLGRCNQDCCDVCLYCYESTIDKPDIYPCPTIQTIQEQLK